jgi:hypothetical protein
VFSTQSTDFGFVDRYAALESERSAVALRGGRRCRKSMPWADGASSAQSVNREEHGHENSRGRRRHPATAAMVESARVMRIVRWLDRPAANFVRASAIQSLVRRPWSFVHKLSLSVATPTSMMLSFFCLSNRRSISERSGVEVGQ